MSYQKTMKLSLLTIFWASTITMLYAQSDVYKYQREISGNTEEWNKITLPSDIYKDLRMDYKDLRIISITADNDTIEAPYILDDQAHKRSLQETNMNIINQSTNDQGYYFTLEMENSDLVNLISLDFTDDNFDWYADIDGSNDQLEWFTIAKEKRLISINNENVNYNYSDISIPDSKFNFYRILIRTNQKPKLRRASTYLQRDIVSSLKKYQVISLTSTKLPKNKSKVKISLVSKVPISSIDFHISDQNNYYRDYVLKAKSDSIKTDKGWSYIYKTLHVGTLSSATDNKITFNTFGVKDLELIIDHKNNTPISIDSVSIFGKPVSLITQLSPNLNYRLIYSNHKASRPQYDINHFKDEIPARLNPLILGGKADYMRSIDTDKNSPMIQNKLWLYLLMGLIILVLGSATIKMIRQESS